MVSMSQVKIKPATIAFVTYLNDQVLSRPYKQGINCMIPSLLANQYDYVVIQCNFMEPLLS